MPESASISRRHLRQCRRAGPARLHRHRPAVNLASRLEGLTKRLGRPLLCERLRRGLSGSLLSLGFQRVRRLAEPEEIFAPEDGALA